MKKQFYITGFDGNLKRANFNGTHYYKDGRFLVQRVHGCNHINEKEMFDKMQKDGLIKYL